jgi:hypothetical protein
LHVFKPRNEAPDGVSQLLSDASQEKSESDRVAVEAAKVEVRAAFNTSTSKPTAKRGSYNVFPPEVRATIGRFASQHGNTKAARQFSAELKVPVSESSVRNIKKDYLKVLQKTNQEIEQLMHGARGKPVKLGVLDEKVQS